MSEAAATLQLLVPHLNHMGPERKRAGYIVWDLSMYIQNSLPIHPVDDGKFLCGLTSGGDLASRLTD